jgi:cobalamin biosynthesis Co2+ chelatase CbiK
MNYKNFFKNLEKKLRNLYLPLLLAATITFSPGCSREPMDIYTRLEKNVKKVQTMKEMVPTDPEEYDFSFFGPPTWNDVNKTAKKVLKTADSAYNALVAGGYNLSAKNVLEIIKGLYMDATLEKMKKYKDTLKVGPYEIIKLGEEIKNYYKDYMVKLEVINTNVMGPGGRDTLYLQLRGRDYTLGDLIKSVEK